MISMDWHAHPPFCYLDESALQKVDASMIPRSFAAGELVFQQGDEGESMHLVTGGEFEVFVDADLLGSDHVLNKLGQGDVFGEIAIFSGEKRMASVRCRRAGATRELSREVFLEILEAEPKAAVHMARQLARTLRKISPLQSGVGFHDLDRSRDYSQVAKQIHRRISRLCRGLILDTDETHASIAMVDPADANARDFLAGIVKPKLPIFLAITEEDFAWYSATYLRETVGVSNRREDFPRLTYATGETIQSTDAPDGAQELHHALCLALGAGASDLHLEPYRDGAKIRLRIDGRLLECAHLTRATAEQVISRLKILCDLDITRRRLPQDGSARLFWDGKPVDFRASFLPCVDAERAVLRFLSENLVIQRLEHLVHSPGLAASMSDLFSHPDGLILVTGATGSGKTTTLYAALRHIWEQDHSLNIVTIEDPVDRRLDFASQIQIDPGSGFTFARALRAVLRQDPDVILVGEIRDEESAEIAVQAAGTGHLVLSTLHTHSAAEAISRLRKLGVESWMMASVLRSVISQRLVPTLAPGQSEQQTPEPRTLKTLIDNGILPQDWQGTLAHPKSADDESGRLALFEVLRISADVRAALGQDVPASDLPAIAGKDNYVSMASYAGTVLHAGLVGPSRIAECFPSHVSFNSLGH
jgi:type II secretory ATPase GspE/PulE/Tfp pilus assembly ATPase PilB-like protein